MDRNHMAHYCIGAVALGVALFAAHKVTHLPPMPTRTVVMSPPPQMAPGGQDVLVAGNQVDGGNGPAARAAGRHVWPSLGQDKTIIIGEALQAAAMNFGSKEPPAVTIYCNSQDCDGFAHDLDDAFQIADWPAEFEHAYVDAESDKGVFVGPIDNPTAKDLAAALTKAGLDAKLVESATLAIIIGRKP